jgi:dihydropteroate synthase
VAEGADILDVGGESTRPFSSPVDLDEEVRRVSDVVERLAGEAGVPVSIDTSKALVASRALELGAEIINDVTGLEGDPDMLRVARESGAGICAMHMQGTPQTMQIAPHYDDVVAEIHAYLAARRDALVASGIPLGKICLDPGIGFGKTHAHNRELMAHARVFLDLGTPILVGHSRKGFIGKALEQSLGRPPPATNSTRAPPPPPATSPRRESRSSACTPWARCGRLWIEKRRRGRVGERFPSERLLRPERGDFCRPPEPVI